MTAPDDDEMDERLFLWDDCIVERTTLPERRRRRRRRTPNHAISLTLPIKDMTNLVMELSESDAGWREIQLAVFEIADQVEKEGEDA